MAACGVGAITAADNWATAPPTRRDKPAKIAGLSDVADVCAGAAFVLTLRKDGSVWGWGSNNYGQLGDGTTRDAMQPRRVDALKNVTNLAAGAYHSLAVTSDGRVWSWGKNSDGQLGNGTLDDNPVPTPFADVSGAKAVAAGWSHSVMLRSDGTVWAWGGNVIGTVGEGRANRQRAARSRIAKRNANRGGQLAFAGTFK